MPILRWTWSTRFSTEKGLARSLLLLAILKEGPPKPIVANAFVAGERSLDERKGCSKPTAPRKRRRFTKPSGGLQDDHDPNGAAERSTNWIVWVQSNPGENRTRRLQSRTYAMK
jgi:hypothetical protein